MIVRSEEKESARPSKAYAEWVAGYRRWRMAAVMATLVVLAIGLCSTPAHALAACATKSLAACCKINKPGLYSLASR